MLDCADIPRFVNRADWRCDVPLYGVERQVKDFVDSGLQVDPDFQRGHVWTCLQRRRWLEYLLKGGVPVGDILCNHQGWKTDYTGEFVLVDGKQRLTAVLDFLKDGFPVFFGVCGKPGGWVASEMPKALFRRVSIGFSVNALQTRAEVLKWYLELNQGAVAHTEEELTRVEGLLLSETLL